jgi:hypothetical protein
MWLTEKDGNYWVLTTLTAGSSVIGCVGPLKNALAGKFIPRSLPGDSRWAGAPSQKEVGLR